MSLPSAGSGGQAARRPGPAGPAGQPLCRCRVIYLGSSVPHVTKNGLHGVQQPLRSLYPERQLASQGRSLKPTSGAVDISHLSAASLGIDSWLSVWSNGLLLENCDELGRQVRRFFAIDSLHYCAAVRYFDTRRLPGQMASLPADQNNNNQPNQANQDNQQSGLSNQNSFGSAPSSNASTCDNLATAHSSQTNLTNVSSSPGTTGSAADARARPQAHFLPLDAPLFGWPAMLDASQPPVFAAILRRTSGIKVLECHAFICRRDAAANALVRCCTHAYADLLNARRLSLELSRLTCDSPPANRCGPQHQGPNQNHNYGRPAPARASPIYAGIPDETGEPQGRGASASYALISHARPRQPPPGSTGSGATSGRSSPEQRASRSLQELRSSQRRASQPADQSPAGRHQTGTCRRTKRSASHGDVRPSRRSSSSGRAHSRPPPPPNVATPTAPTTTSGLPEASPQMDRKRVSRRSSRKKRHSTASSSTHQPFAYQGAPFAQHNPPQLHTHQLPGPQHLLGAHNRAAAAAACNFDYGCGHLAGPAYHHPMAAHYGAPLYGAPAGLYLAPPPPPPPGCYLAPAGSAEMAAYATSAAHLSRFRRLSPTSMHMLSTFRPGLAVATPSAASATLGRPAGAPFAAYTGLGGARERRQNHSKRMSWIKRLSLTVSSRGAAQGSAAGQLAEQLAGAPGHKQRPGLFSGSLTLGRLRRASNTRPQLVVPAETA